MADKVKDILQIQHVDSEWIKAILDRLGLVFTDHAKHDVENTHSVVDDLFPQPCVAGWEQFGPLPQPHTFKRTKLEMQHPKIMEGDDLTQLLFEARNIQRKQRYRAREAYINLVKPRAAAASSQNGS